MLEAKIVNFMEHASQPTNAIVEVLMQLLDKCKPEFSPEGMEIILPMKFWPPCYGMRLD
jgi:hypothetical protein